MDLRELYQETILDHSRKPRNHHALPGARSAEGYNPLCGDHVSVELRVEDGMIRDIGFQGSGCAISKASASMMTAALKGKTAAEAATLFKAFHAMVTADLGATFDPLELGKLAAFAGVHEFPIRVKCATLSWHTLRAALKGWAETSSME